MASGSSFTADEVLQLALTEENDDIFTDESDDEFVTESSCKRPYKKAAK